MQKLFGAKLLRPQRLIHIGLEEELRRVQDSWWYHDWVLWLACFSSLDELAQHVENAATFREHIRKTVMLHSDQMPFYVKLSPGKQLYMKEETTDAKKPLSAEEKALIGNQGGGSQKAETQIGADFAEGMTQLRGESHGNQDKFRITVDLEQAIYGYLDPEVAPSADFGITSVIFTGAHFREHNVDKHRCYIEDEKFYRDGIEICHLAGTRVEGGLGNQILDFRDDHPELFEAMKALKIRFYQQPAGFEDSCITCWKIQEQLKMHGQNISLRDLFTGALSKWARDESFLCQQLCAWVRSKVTAVIQTADCVVIKPVKCKTAQKHIQLRKELIQLAEFENTRAVFKCGVYEIMRTLYEVIKECGIEFRVKQRLLKGIFQLGWCCLRPDYENGKLRDCTKEDWCSGKDWKLGGHRIKESWIQTRLQHLDVNNKPQPRFQEVDSNGFTKDCEQTYMVKQGEKRSLEVWKKMVEDEEVTDEQVKEFQDEPWFEMSVSTFRNIKGLEECADLLRTPAQQRLAAGLDPKLTTQKANTEKAASRKRKRDQRTELRKPLRAEAMKQMRDLRQQGHSIAQVSAALICPELGKGKKAKKKFRDGMAAQLAKLKNKKPDASGKGKEKKESEEDKKVIRSSFA